MLPDKEVKPDLQMRWWWQKEDGKRKIKVRRSKELEMAVEKYLKIKKIPYLRVENYICYKCHAVQNSKAKGMPDFILFDLINPDRGFHLLAVECKTGKYSKLTKEQKYYKELFERCGTHYIVLRDTIDEILKYFGDK